MTETPGVIQVVSEIVLLLLTAALFRGITRRLRLPFTVVLVLAGIGLSYLAAYRPAFLPDWRDIELSPALFRAGCGPVSLVVDGGRVVVVDEASARVVRGYSRDDIRGLKVYDTYEDRISFRLLLAGDAESRLIVSRDPGETIPLFQWMQQASKPVIYVA